MMSLIIKRLTFDDERTHNERLTIRHFLFQGIP